MFTCQEASPEDKAIAFEQVHVAWPHAADRSEHLKLRLASPQHQRAAWFVGKLDGEVVTSLGAYPYQLFGPDEHRSARVFGAVFTPPAARGHAHAKHLLKWVMQYYQERGVQDFALFSDIGLAYYQDLGFVALPSYEWELAVPADIRPEGVPAPVSVPLTLTRPGAMACAYGFERASADDAWIQGKQASVGAKPPQLRLARWGDHHWLLSRLEGERYLLLESNLSQEAPDWTLFKKIVQLDAAAAGCLYVQGWWTAAAPRPDPMQLEILPREKEVLMWTSKRGKIDAWYEPIARHGFRVFVSEHV